MKIDKDNLLAYSTKFLYSVNDEFFYFEYTDINNKRIKIKLSKSEYKNYEKEKINIELGQMYDVCGYPEEYDFFKDTKYYKPRNLEEDLL